MTGNSASASPALPQGLGGGLLDAVTGAAGDAATLSLTDITIQGNDAYLRSPTRGGTGGGRRRKSYRTPPSVSLPPNRDSISSKIGAKPGSSRYLCKSES